MTSGPMGDDEGLLTEEEVAALLQVSLPTVHRLRQEGSGPPCVEVGRQMRLPYSSRLALRHPRIPTH